MTSLKIEESADRTRLMLCTPEGKPVTLVEQLLGQLEAALQTLKRKPPRLVVLASALSKYFCVGAEEMFQKNVLFG